MSDDVEYWRCRALAAERLLKGNEWDLAISPLTLHMTRIVRLLAVRDMSPHDVADALADDYPATSSESVKKGVSEIRKALAWLHVPPAVGGSRLYSVGNRDDLKAWLASRGAVVPGDC